MIVDFRAVPAADGRFVWVHGELDSVTATEFGMAMNDPVRAGGAVVLDLTRLSFIDSDGIRALIDVAKRLHGRGCVILHNPTPHVAKVFGIVQLAELPNLHLLDSRHGDIALPDGPGAWSRLAAFHELTCDVQERLLRVRSTMDRNVMLRRRHEALRTSLAAHRAQRVAVSM